VSDVSNINRLASILFYYTRRLVALVAIVASSAPVSAAPCLVYHIEEVDGHRIIYVDGWLGPGGSEEGNLPAGGGGGPASASGGGVDLLHPWSLLNVIPEKNKKRK